MSIRPKNRTEKSLYIGHFNLVFFSFNLRHCPRNWIHLFVFAWEKKKSRYISCAWVCNVQKRVPDDNPKTTKIECFCDSATFETKWFWLHFWSSACVVHDNLWFWGAVKVLIIILIFRQNDKKNFLLPKTERCELNSKNEQSNLKRCWKMWLQQRIPCLGCTFSSLFGFFCVFQLFVVLLFRWRIKCDPKMLHVFDTLQRWWIIKQIKKKVYPSHGFKAWNAVMRYTLL